MIVVVDVERQRLSRLICATARANVSRPRLIVRTAVLVDCHVVVARLESGLVIYGRHRDREGHILGLVIATVVRAAIVGQGKRHGRPSVRIVSGSECQVPRRLVDVRLLRKQVMIVVVDVERQRLSRLICATARANVSRPRLIVRAAVLVDCHVEARSVLGRVVDRVHSHEERIRGSLPVRRAGDGDRCRAVLVVLEIERQCVVHDARRHQG